MIPDDEVDEVRQLYAAEYGWPVELLLRFTIIFGCGAAYYLYQGGLHAVVWLAVYGIAHAIYYALFCRALRHPTRLTRRLLEVFYPLLLGVFLTLPSWVFTQDDPALRLPAGAALVATMVFQIRRADRSVVLLVGELIVFGAMFTFIAWASLSKSADPLVDLAMLASAAGCYGYFALSLVNARKVRLGFERAAEDLKEAHKMAAIGHLSGGISHDFNNVLTSIMGNIELALEFNKDDDVREYLQDAYAASERAAGIVKRLQLFAQTSKMTCEELDLAGTLEEMLPRLQGAAPHAINIELKAEQNCPLVRLDPQLLEAVLQGLIDRVRLIRGQSQNLVIHVGSVACTHGCNTAGGNSLPPGKYVQVELAPWGDRHNGTELASAEPYATLATLARGTGLAVSAAYGYVEQLGGGLLIDAAANTGKMLFPPVGTEHMVDIYGEKAINPMPMG